MKTNENIPNPDNRLNVIKRSLHILALLQNKHEPDDWNGSTLATLLSLDENCDEPVSDKTIRDYITRHLRNEFGINIITEKGGRRIEIAGDLEISFLQKLAPLYSIFTVKDAERETVMKKFINAHPRDCLWIIARLYFASIEKRKAHFDYTTNDNRILEKIEVSPYYTVHRGNNLYLAAKPAGSIRTHLYILSRIKNLKITDNYFKDTIPSVEDLFKDSLGSFIGEKQDVRIRYNSSVSRQIEHLISVLDPEITEFKKEDYYEASFAISDDMNLCKELFLHGDKVEILEPARLRDTMKEMLVESLKLYDKI